MSEPVARILLVVAVVVAALAVALLVPRLTARRAERAPLDLSGVAGRLVLLSAAGCGRCGDLRGRLEALGADVTELRYEDDPERFRATGAAAVPVLVARDAAGREVARAAGRIGAGRLRRLVAASRSGSPGRGSE